MYRNTGEVIDYGKLSRHTFVGWIYGGMEAFTEAAYPDSKGVQTNSTRAPAPK